MASRIADYPAHRFRFYSVIPADTDLRPNWRMTIMMIEPHIPPKTTETTIQIAAVWKGMAMKPVNGVASARPLNRCCGQW